MRYCAFLRAINVGRHNRVKMQVLREAFASAGLRDVSTYLQTGNVLFDWPGDANSAGDAIEAACEGLSLRNVVAAVRTSADFATLFAGDPFAPYPEDRFVRMVTLCRGPLPETAKDFAPARFHIAALRERDVLFAVDRELNLPVNPQEAIERALNVRGTTRYHRVVAATATLLNPP